jgi:hypothetical protein
VGIALPYYGLHQKLTALARTWWRCCRFPRRLSERLVSKDERVIQGQLIGKSGDTGTPGQFHLHFEITDGKFPSAP